MKASISAGKIAGKTAGKLVRQGSQMPQIPENAWQEEGTEELFVEEITGEILIIE